jgi:hypothetical protein
MKFPHRITCQCIGQVFDTVIINFIIRKIQYCQCLFVNSNTNFVVNESQVISPYFFVMHRPDIAHLEHRSNSFEDPVF